MKTAKVLVMMMALLLLVTGINAQKIDQRLTRRLVEKVQTRRAQGLRPMDAKAVNKTIAVDFNADGTIRAFSAIATLNEGAECPTERLEQMGIKVRYVVGRQAALVIPADKLMALEQMEEIRFVRADQMKHLMNMMGYRSMSLFIRDQLFRSRVQRRNLRKTEANLTSKT